MNWASMGEALQLAQHHGSAPARCGSPRPLRPGVGHVGRVSRSSAWGHSATAAAGLGRRWRRRPAAKQARAVCRPGPTPPFHPRTRKPAAASGNGSAANTGTSPTPGGPGDRGGRRIPGGHPRPRSQPTRCAPCCASCRSSPALAGVVECRCQRWRDPGCWSGAPGVPLAAGSAPGLVTCPDEQPRLPLALVLCPGCAAALGAAGLAAVWRGSASPTELLPALPGGMPQRNDAGEMWGSAPQLLQKGRGTLLRCHRCF